MNGATKKRLETVHPIYVPDEWEADLEVERRLRGAMKVAEDGTVTITFPVNL